MVWKTHSIRIYGSRLVSKLSTAFCESVKNKHGIDTAVSAVQDLKEAKDKDSGFHLYMVHLLRFNFVFELNNEPFTATQLLLHLRSLKLPSTSRVVFASCLVHLDVWTNLASMLGPNEHPVPVLICAKMRKLDPLLSGEVLEWLSELDWTDDLLGIGPINHSGIVSWINLRYKWFLL